MSDEIDPAEVGLREAARRCSDAIRLHIVAGNAGRWACIALADGRERVPGESYDSRADAVRLAGSWERNYCYVHIPPDDMGVNAAYSFIRLVRQTHAAGMNMADPEREFYAPQTTLDAIRRAWANGNRHGL